MATRVLVCGDREWTDKDLIKLVLSTVHGPVTVIHGGCRGADEIAGNAAFNMGFKVEQYDANWKKYGRAAGPIRNQVMLDASIDLVLAFHPDLSKSKGTKDMVARARKAGVTVEVYDGNK